MQELQELKRQVLQGREKQSLIKEEVAQLIATNLKLKDELKGIQEKHRESLETERHQIRQLREEIKTKILELQELKKQVDQGREKQSLIKEEVAQLIATNLKLKDELKGIQEKHRESLETERHQGRQLREEIKTKILELQELKKQVDQGREKQSLIKEETLYRMQSRPCGLCLIINNQQFLVPYLMDRDSSQVDCDNLRHLFEDNLGFKVLVETDLPAQAMKETLQAFANDPDHWNNDSAFVFILTHGKEGFLFGTDGDRVDTNDVIALFTGQKCQALAGKPKCIVLQACRGQHSDLGHESHDGQMNPDSPVVVPTELEILKYGMQMLNLHDQVPLPGRPVKMKPTSADMLVFYSTVPGHQSWRDEQGTWFIKAFFQVFSQHASTHSVMDMIVMVNNEMSEAMGTAADGQIVKQMSQASFTLCKTWHLNPALLVNLDQVRAGSSHQEDQSVSNMPAHQPSTSSSSGVVQQQSYANTEPVKCSSEPQISLSSGEVQEQSCANTEDLQCSSEPQISLSSALVREQSCANTEDLQCSSEP